MDDQERYELVCKPALESLRTDINKGFADLNKALFKGNGQPSFTDQLATGREKMKVYDRVLFVVVCGVFIPIIKDVVTHLIKG